MQKFVIYTDSSSDLPQYLIDELGVHVVQLSVTMEGEETVANDKINAKDFWWVRMII